MQGLPESRPRRSPLLEQCRQLMRTKHMSIRTEESYLRWIEQFLLFHKEARGAWVHPSEMGGEQISQFLTALAVKRKVSASTQNQAFSALLFLYKQVLKQEVTIDAVRARRPERVPVVLSVDEVRRVLAELPPGPIALIGGLAYGAGMRLMECCRLRVKDEIETRHPARKSDAFRPKFTHFRGYNRTNPYLRDDRGGPDETAAIS